MNKIIACAAWASGLHAAAFGQTDTRALITLEASTDGGSTWQSSVETTPGSRLDVRVRVELINSTGIIGFGSMTYQPTLSSWHPEAGDVRLPFTSSDGSGVADVLGNTGRISPFSSVAQGTQSASGLLTSHADPGNMLRFAGANAVTLPTNLSWGVVSAQLTRQLAGTNYNPRLNVVVFKYAFTLGPGDGVRTLVADVPLASIQSRRTTWFTPTISSYIYTLTQADISPATINVIPAPAGIGVFVCGMIALASRRNLRQLSSSIVTR
jgi:hypothetical protein